MHSFSCIAAACRCTTAAHAAARMPLRTVQQLPPPSCLHPPLFPPCCLLPPPSSLLPPPSCLLPPLRGSRAPPSCLHLRAVRASRRAVRQRRRPLRGRRARHQRLRQEPRVPARLALAREPRLRPEAERVEAPEGAGGRAGLYAGYVYDIEMPRAFRLTLPPTLWPHSSNN